MRSAPGVAYADPVAYLKSATGVLESCIARAGCHDVSGPIDINVGDTEVIRLQVVCAGVDRACPATGDTYYGLTRPQIELRDDAPPTLQAVSGSLVSGTTTARVRDVSYNASDVGGGLYRQRLVADDNTVLLDGPIDANGGRCALPYGYRVPCRLQATSAISLDTSRLVDGVHRLRLEVFDATNANAGTYAWPAPIVVDNVAPSIGEVRLSGTPKEGRVLSCDASVNGQSPRTTFGWVRVDADSGEEEPIDGADRSAYTLTSADVGRKVVCSVRAVDDGGTAVRRSLPTSPPFSRATVVAGGVPSAGLPLPPLCTRTTMRLARAASTRLRPYRTSAFVLRGRVADAAGVPRGGAVLQLQQSVTYAGLLRRSAIGTVRSEGDGTFRMTVPAGPTRVLQMVETGCGAIGSQVAQRVRGGLSASTTTARVRNNQTAHLRGRVLGGYLGRGLPVELQVKVAGRWKDVKAAVSDRRGHVAVSYRFTRTFVRYTYQFRLVTRAAGAWPYIPARSATVRVRVN